MADDLPVVVGKAGMVPRLPAEALQTLISKVTAVRPGYTANLPGALIEDISSTDVAAIIECDSAAVETVNSLTPYGANSFLLTQLGAQLGVPFGSEGSNTSVFVLFRGTPGFVIAKGFTVSDGTYQYVIQTGGIIGTDGQSDQLFAVASLSGSWAVPPGTVTVLTTSVPTTITLSCENPEAGVPGTDSETQEDYRGRVLQAQLAASQGMARYLKTLVRNVPGVQTRLVSVKQRDDGKWMVICGGGDPYKVANAIWTALFDINNIVGSQFIIEGITNADPGVITTFLNTGYTAGENFTISDCNPSDYDGDYAVLSVIDQKTFRMGKPFAAQNVASQSWSGGDITWTFGSNHGISVGSSFTIANSLPSGYSGTFTAVAGTSGTTLKATAADPGASTQLGGLLAGVALFDTTGLPLWVSGGLLTPNARNISASINDYPDTFVVTYVNPPQQIVTMTVTWNTTSPNFVSQAAVAQLSIPGLVNYINSLFAGQPINLLSLDEVFRASIVSILAPELVTRLVFSVSIDGVGVSPIMGSQIIEGDAESYFYTTVGDISVVQG